MSTTLPENLSASLVVSEEIRRELMASPATAEAEAFTIDSHLLAQEASDLAGECRAQVKRVYVLFAGFVEPAKLIIERANSIFKPRLADLEGASQIYMAKIGVWTESETRRVAEENAKRVAEARRLRQEAEAKAAAERARAEEIAREQRRKAQDAQEALQKAQAEGNARAAAAAAAASAAALQKAEAAIETGAAKAAEAEAVAAQAVVSAPAEAQAKIKGQTMRDNWVGRLKPGLTADAARDLIIEAAVTRKDLRGLIEIKTGGIDKLAKALHEAMDVPGYEAVNDQKSVGAKR